MALFSFAKPTLGRVLFWVGLRTY